MYFAFLRTAKLWRLIDRCRSRSTAETLGSNVKASRCPIRLSCSTSLFSANCREARYIMQQPQQPLQPRLRQRTHRHGGNREVSDSHSHEHSGRCCSRLRVSTTFRFSGVIAVATCFFFGELIVGILMRSLALVADAFHILSDLLGYAVALAAYRFSKRKDFPTAYTFGYQKAEILGGFFNGGKRLPVSVARET